MNIVKMRTKYSGYKVKEKKTISSTFNKRTKILLVVFFIFAGLICAKLFILQVIEHGFYEALATGQHEIYKDLFPERGEILVGEEVSDKHYALATNQELSLVYADPRHIEDPEEFLSKLEEILDFDYEKENEEGIEEEEGDEEEGESAEREALLARISDRSDPYEPIMPQVSDELVEQIRALELAGVGFIGDSFRFYPEKNLGGHVAGFVGSDEEGDRSGKYGVEGYFDVDLKGEQGFLHSALDASGSWITVADRSFKPAIDGADVYLTIDRNIQYQACTKLYGAVAKHGADGGSIIIMRPNGKILAMCSAPDFDPNNYNEVEDIQVFNNPAIFNQYEPGSVFKAITMAAALNEGAVQPDTTYEDEGEIKYGEHIIKNFDEKANGVQTMTQVLEKSINTGAIFAMEQIGKERFRDYVHTFGFGKKTGIQLETESPGNISSLDQRGDIFAATASFGQGITTTPLQMVASFAAIANGGKLVKPYIIDKVIYSNGDQAISSPTEIREVITERTATLLRGMMVTVVEQGHGRRAKVPGYYVAGKTGTAQVPKTNGLGYDPNVTIGSFIGFAPAQDPAFIMLVKIDRPDVQWGSESAAPVFGEMAQYLLNYLQVPPDYE